MKIQVFQYNTHLFYGTVPGKVPGTTYEDEMRLKGIIEKMESLDVDFITLEEVWGDDASKQPIITEMAKHTQFWTAIRDTIDTPFSVGSGLLLLSRHPVEFGEIDGKTVPQFTKFEKSSGSDALAEKGFLTVRVSPSGGKPFWIIHTHTQADYNPTAVSDRADNIRQIIDRVQWIHSEFKQPVVVVGDLNVIGEEAGGLETTEYAAIKKQFSSVGLVDAYRSLHPDPSKTEGFTYDGTRNRLIEIFAPADKAAQYRLDYCFVDSGLGIKPVEAQVVDEMTYTDPTGSVKTDLSDHYPIRVKCEIPDASGSVDR